MAAFAARSNHEKADRKRKRTAGGIFGFDENLNYFLNGEYPLAGEGWGATSDQIVLEAGDFIDIGSFSSWDFYMDSNDLWYCCSQR